jgi:hypothetical protein
MTLKCWKRKANAASGDAQVNKNPSKPGNELKKGDGIQPLSLDPNVRHPYWEDPAAIIKSD